MATPVNFVLETLVNEAATRVCNASHGGKESIYQDLAAKAGWSIGTAKRHVSARLAGLRGRKQRSDAGTSGLLIEEAHAIAAYLMESRRKTGKQLADIEAAIEQLRTDGLIQAGRVDVETGEIRPLSASAIARAMRHYNCHPGQLEQPAPKVEIRTLHPNHLWQIDPSLCVLYYLKTDDALRAMPSDEFYKNKPRNLARIEHERVWRYVFACHTSGSFYLEYVLGAESGENLCGTFINAIQARGAHDPFHGVPLMAMLDPGSANTGHMFRNLCAVLDVRLIINKPGQPWAKGSVEKHNDIVEREFEHRLKFYRVSSLAELNQAAWNWSIHFQITRRHSRHGLTRFAAWQRITPEQLRVAPPADVCRQLAVHAPEERTVTPQLRVGYRGFEYDVRHVPGVLVGGKVRIARNAWADEDTAHVLAVDDDGQQTQFVVPRLRTNEFGFTEAAVTFGSYKAQPDTVADTQRKAVERVVMGATTDEEAAAKRKAGVLPFGGAIKPMQPAAPQVAYIARRGTPLQVDAPNVVDLTVQREAPPERKREFPPYSLVEAARTLIPLLQARGVEWTSAMLEATEQRYPDGVPYDELEAWADTLWQRAQNVVTLHQRMGA